MSSKKKERPNIKPAVVAARNGVSNLWQPTDIDKAKAMDKGKEK